MIDEVAEFLSTCQIALSIELVVSPTRRGRVRIAGTHTRSSLLGWFQLVCCCRFGAARCHEGMMRWLAVSRLCYRAFCKLVCAGFPRAAASIVLGYLPWPARAFCIPVAVLL